MTPPRGKAQSPTTKLMHRHTYLAIFLALATLLLSPHSLWAAKKKPWTLKDRLRVQVLYDLGYDSNYLNFSERDLDKFQNGTLTLVTDIETYDALVQSAGMKFNLRTPTIAGWRYGFVTYTVSYNRYANNSFNNRAVHSLWVSHNLIRQVDFIGSYLYIPNRYLRDYYDRDYGTYHASQFEYMIGGAGLRYSPNKLRGLTLSGRYESSTIYYNPRFTEYDTEGWGVRFDARYRVSRALTVTGIYKKRLFDNVGYTGVGASGIQIDEDSEYGDGSYGEDWFEFLAAVRTPSFLDRSWNVNAGARFRHRYYTSSIPLTEDPIHRGREHLHSLFTLSASTQILQNLEGGPSLEYETRRTDSPLDWVARVKDYDSWRVGLSLSYTIW